MSDNYFYLNEIELKTDGSFSRIIPEEPITPDELVYCLQWEVFVNKEPPKLYDLMAYINKMSAKNLKQFSYIFNCDFKSIFKEMKQDTETQPQLDRLVVKRSVSVFDSEKPWVSDSIECMGVKEGSDDLWGIDLIPASELKDLKVTINYTSDFYILKNSGKDEHQHWKVRSHIRLLDFIQAISTELSFFGTDENKKDFINKLNERMNKIDSGEEKLIPWKEVKERLKKVID